MIRGVIFDVDGVLLNSMPVWENLGEIYLERLGIEAEKGLGETLFAMSLEEGADYLIEGGAGFLRAESPAQRRRARISAGIPGPEDPDGDRHVGRPGKCRGGAEASESPFVFPGGVYLYGDRQQQEPAGHLLCGGPAAGYGSVRHMGVRGCAPCHPDREEGRIQDGGGI